jgi:Fe-S-cluster containining protein
VDKLIQIEEGDRRLLAGVADVLAEAARRSGDWLVCRPGCTQCCFGPFAINSLDALRLRDGLAMLDRTDPARAARVRLRAAEYVSAIVTLDEDGLPDSMDDVACPALDAETGLCDLYAARPMICRSFGPVTRTGEGMLAACELCYQGATDEEMERCAVVIDPQGLEGDLLKALADTGAHSESIVARALM